MRKNGQTDRQTDTTKLIAVFRYFANAYKNTVFCDVKPDSARNLGMLLRNMRPLSTSTPKIDFTFLQNFNSIPPKRHL